MPLEDVQKELWVIEAVCKDDTQENIVKVLGTGMLKNSSCYFVDMERCDLTLREYLNGKIPVTNPAETMNRDDALVFNGMFLFKRRHAWSSVRKALYIVGQISRGINFIHGKNLVHRDINPNNSNSCGIDQS